MSGTEEVETVETVTRPERVWTRDNFAAQEDKTTEYAKLMEFAEGAAAKFMFFAVSIVTEGDEIVGVSGRVNRRTIRITNSPNRNNNKGRKQITGKAHFIRGLGQKFTVETAKEEFARLAYPRRPEEDNMDCLRMELQAWDAVGILARFLPASVLSVCDYGARSTVQVSLKGKVLAKVTEASLHVAKHVVACKVLNLAQFSNTFLEAGNMSYAATLNKLATDCIDEYKQMRFLSGINQIKDHVSFNEDTGEVEVDVAMSGAGEDVEAAAKNALSRLDDLRLKKQKKKSKTPTKRPAKAAPVGLDAKKAMVEGKSPISILNDLYSNTVVYSIVPEAGAGPFMCSVQVNGQTFSVANCQNKKVAKTSAAYAAVQVLCS